MKSLSELGVSPWPWTMPSCCLSEGFVWGGDGYAVCHISGRPSDTFNAMHDLVEHETLKYPTMGPAQPCAWNDYANPEKAKSNARLIAAAPELYEALRDAVIEVCSKYGCAGNMPEFKCCDKRVDCFVKKWRAALAKASGEEAK